MKYWKLIVATVVIFGAGVFTGGLLLNCCQHSHSKNSHGKEVTSSATNSVASTNVPSVTSPAPRLPDILSKPFLPKLDDLLHLSLEQHKVIEKIISDAQGQMKKVMQDSRMEVRSQLTPEQRAKFDELMKRPVKRPPSAANGLSALPESNFKTKLEKIIERQPAGSNLSPEAQVILLEAERAKAQSQQGGVLPPLPPPVLTNAP